jgi:hypothetical protein
MANSGISRPRCSDLSPEKRLTKAERDDLVDWITSGGEAA